MQVYTHIAKARGVGTLEGVPADSVSQTALNGAALRWTAPRPLLCFRVMCYCYCGTHRLEPVRVEIDYRIQCIEQIISICKYLGWLKQCDTSVERFHYWGRLASANLSGEVCLLFRSSSFFVLLSVTLLFLETNIFQLKLCSINIL